MCFLDKQVNGILSISQGKVGWVELRSRSTQPARRYRKDTVNVIKLFIGSNPIRTRPPLEKT